MDRVKGFLISKALLKGDSSTTSRPLRHLRGESEWKIGPTVLTLCEHLFVSFAIRMLRKQAESNCPCISLCGGAQGEVYVEMGIGKFVLSGIVAYIDGRLCRSIPNPLARRIVSGFLLSFLEKDDH
ncbi:hypothetical protein CK203_000230 [Vitis vinifera]|uniref:Uncharacterized protein n=1 Tax=Vitis vinifera TaxID=29760 RepID=A0A438KQQ4_VITVI|nr:hypothetical protein CK203_000230 [Vitis vinifera]